MYLKVNSKQMPLYISFGKAVFRVIRVRLTIGKTMLRYVEFKQSAVR